MPSNSLVLLPSDGESSIASVDGLIRLLQDLGVIGDAFPDANTSYYRAGPRFLEHLTFLGCSPVIALDAPGANGEFCRISVSRFDEPRFLGGVNTKAPRCPGCGYREESWPSLVSDWELKKGDYRWQCPSCRISLAASQLRWRQCAGFGRLLITIEGIFEGEAVPGEELLEALQRLSGHRWDYFYFRC